MRFKQTEPVAPPSWGARVIGLLVVAGLGWLGWRTLAFPPHGRPLPSAEPPLAKRNVASKPAPAVAVEVASPPPLPPRTGESCLLQIESQPAGAILALDGIAMGRTPATVNVRCGVGVSLGLTLPGYRGEVLQFMPKKRKNDVVLVLNRASVDSRQ